MALEEADATRQDDVGAPADAPADASVRPPAPVRLPPAAQPDLRARSCGQMCLDVATNQFIVVPADDSMNILADPARNSPRAVASDAGGRADQSGRCVDAVTGAEDLSGLDESDDVPCKRTSGTMCLDILTNQMIVVPDPVREEAAEIDHSDGDGAREAPASPGFMRGMHVFRKCFGEV